MDEIYNLYVRGDDDIFHPIPALKGDKGDSGKFKYANVTLEAALWSDGVSPFTQTMDIEGVGENTCINLCPDANVIQASITGKYVLSVVNNNGVVTFYAINNKPTTNIVMQVQIVEVEQ